MINKRHYKWQITINNPIKNGNLTHDKIKRIVTNLKSIVYFCMVDEIGENETPHTHIFIYCKNAIRFSTLKNNFPKAHIEQALGSVKQNREYLLKEGNHEDKKYTQVEGTFYEEGEIPEEKQGKRNDITKIYEAINHGLDVLEILDLYPQYSLKLNNIITLYNKIQSEKINKDLRKELKVTYIYGLPGTGKTSYIFENYDIENIYIADSSNPNMFDEYHYEDVLVLDEFNSSIQITQLNRYLDIYPISLKARYVDKKANYNEVVIISNVFLSEQYPQVQIEKDIIYEAFLRRIHKVIEITYFEFIEFDTVEDSFQYNSIFRLNSLENFSNSNNKPNYKIKIKISNYAIKALSELIKGKSSKNYYYVFKEIIQKPYLYFIAENFIRNNSINHQNYIQTIFRFNKIINYQNLYHKINIKSVPQHVLNHLQYSPLFFEKSNKLKDISKEMTQSEIKELFPDFEGYK